METSGGAREAFCARPCFDLSAMPSDDENSLEWKALLFEELEAQRGAVTCPRGSVTGSLFFLRVGGQARLPRPLEVSDRAALVSVVWHLEGAHLAVPEAAVVTGQNPSALCDLGHATCLLVLP